MLPPPDLIISLGPRGLLSLAGIVLLIGGVWRSDRSWDEEGSKAYERAEAASNTNDKSDKPAATPSRPLLSKTTVEIPMEELQAAFPFPWPFLLGWSIFAISFFSPTTGSTEILVSGPAIAAAAISMALGWIASVPMADAVMTRDASKKATLGMLFVLSWLGLTVVPFWDETIPSNSGLAFRVVGAISIIASMKILWKFRKMGDSWEQEGKPNPNPVVYNVGGPLFVFGWFLFWIGVAATDELPEDVDVNNILKTGLPIYFTSRSILAFAAGCGMVPVVMFVDYAHDEGAEFLGFGTDGRFFGRFLESPIPFVAAWTLFGLASWLGDNDSDLTTISGLQWTILVNCVAQGIVAGIMIQSYLYKQDLAGKTRWSIPFVLLFLALAVELGYFGGSGRLWLSLPGAFFIILGQKTVFGDRKRGDYWMETGEVNPNPIVYSYGEPLFMMGWILMSLVMSMPL